MGPSGERWSWPTTEAGRKEARRHANRLVGQQIRTVRYVDIDYWREQRADGFVGPRVIDDNDEWGEPAWRYDTFDSIDFAVEIETTEGRFFTVTWGPPANDEGLELRETRAIARACGDDASAAVWDVTRRSRWRAYLRRDVTEVVLHFRPWWTKEVDAGQDDFWCPRITIVFGATAAEFLLADADRKGQIGPSSDNVAVVFDPANLPTWADGT